MNRSKLIQGCRRGSICAIYIICYLVLVIVVGQLLKVVSGLFLGPDSAFFLASLPLALVPFIYLGFRWLK